MTAAILLAMLAAPPVVVTVPRIAPPNIDGQLGDSAWSTAAALEGFTSPTSTAVPAKATAAWMGFDEHAVYLAFRCAEPQPDRLKATALAGSADVWQDDCVEVFLRSTGHPLEFEQFIVNSQGITQALRQRRQRETKPWQPQWRARAAVAGDCWTAELAIPFVALERPAPRPGERLGLKLGREDYTLGEQVLSAWPAGSSYAGTEDYAEVFLERDNLLLNPDLRLTRDGRPADWVFSRDNADAQLVTPVDLGGRPAIKIAGPGRYLVMQQSQRLLPRRDYLLSMRVSGTAPLYFRTRCVLEPGQDSTRTDLQYRPAEQEVPLALRFTTGHDGQTLLIIGTVDGSAVGTSYLRELTLREADHREASGQAIPLLVGRLTEIRRLLLADCRLSRGFCGSPVDGTTNSYGWNAMRWEYGMGGAGAGVGYGWGNNEGVHLTLAEESAVAAVQIRGGVRGKLYGAGAAYDHPADAPLIHEFPGGTRRSRALLAHPVRTSMLSLFGLADGHLADVQIFAVSQPAEASDEGQPFVAASTAGDLAPWVARKFGESERALAPPGPTLPLPGSRAVHLISEPQPSEVAWDALLLQSTTTQGPARLPLTLTVHDPLNPRLELVVVDLELPADGARLRLKFPTQVVPQGTRLWLTLRAEADAQLAAPALLRLVTRPRETHEPAALGYRTLLMRSFFTAASEARQWNTIRASTNLDDWAKTNQWGEQVLEVMRTIEQAGQIAPNDDLVRQYREWVHRNARPVELQAELPAGGAAPEWAVAAREAWLGSRAVARWWLDHRLVPNGELGGLVGDDSDMYQNWADLPLFESDGVGGRVKEAGARLMELAAAENLTGGLNRVTTDPLHAYEEGVNHLALMTFWSYGDPLYLERCFENARNTEALTVVTPAGHRHFRSQQISAQDITTPRPPEIDGEAHPLMWHPSLEVAWYNRSPAVLRRLDEWASGWLAHLEPGKYAESVEVATETAKSVRPYALAGGYGSQATTFASLYLLTGDLKYLQPWLAEWQRSGWSRQGSVVLQEFAELLPAGALGPKERDCQRANPITCYRLHGDKAPLIEALRRDVAELQRFGAMYTSAEVFTDRVFLYPLLNPARCYLGGEWTRNSFTRDHAVSWSGFGTDYAALVQTNRPDRLRVLLYNFAAEPLRGEARVWRLSHGRYRLRLGPDHNGDDRLDQVAVEREVTLRRGDRLPLILPPGVVTVLELEQTAALENLFERPDLALAPRDLRTGAGGVTCRVHNLGAATAPASKVALLDAQGHLLATAVAPPIEAPLDLAPHSVEVSLGVAPPTGPWRVAVDPDDAIAEINEANNAATAP